VPTARDSGQRSPRKLLRAVVARLLGRKPEARCMYLEVTLLNGQNYSIPVEEGHSVEEELELFLSRDGRYAGDWVPLQKASRQLFVRYEQIVLVSPMD
jgi:hypothetical protein